ARARAAEQGSGASPHLERLRGRRRGLVELRDHIVLERVGARFGGHRLDDGCRPQRGQERSAIDMHGLLPFRDRNYVMPYQGQSQFMSMRTEQSRNDFAGSRRGRRSTPPEYPATPRTTVASWRAAPL